VAEHVEERFVMNKAVGNFIVFVFLFSCLQVIAQNKDYEREKIRKMEEDKKNDKQRGVNQQLDSAVALMDREEYQAADEKFVYVLKNIKSVPSDLAYYFGKNSYFLGKYKQSIDWLNKYIQLKGTSGKFSEDAVGLMQLAEEQVLAERQVVAKQTQEVLSRDYNIDCGPSGKVMCPVCGGSGVIVKKNYLGETYKACNHCHKTGFLTCDEYNKLVRGELTVN
jgi:hypothetical protein